MASRHVTLFLYPPKKKIDNSELTPKSDSVQIIYISGKIITLRTVKMVRFERVFSLVCMEVLMIALFGNNNGFIDSIAQNEEGRDDDC